MEYSSVLYQPAVECSSLTSPACPICPAEDETCMTKIAAVAGVAVVGCGILMYLTKRHYRK